MEAVHYDNNSCQFEVMMKIRNPAKKTIHYSLFTNNKGIALVMVLILSLISLAIVSAMLYMLTQGTQMSGSQKFYRTAEEASFGGANIAGALIQARGATVSGDLFDKLSASIGDAVPSSSTGCTADKLGFAKSAWSSCTNPNDLTWDPTSNPDMIFDLGKYRVFAKIVDTVAGNSEVSNLVTGGGQLGGQGTVAANSAMISPPHVPYLYSIEIQAQDKDSDPLNPRERSDVEALYAY